jgi:TatD DNase family protein
LTRPAAALRGAEACITVNAMYVDSHAHLEGPEYDADRAAVLERARDAGVRYLLLIGGARGPETLGAAVAAADANPVARGGQWIYAAEGIHPHEASRADASHYDILRRLARHPRFLAIGEIGLDYHYDHSPRGVQREVFIRQLELARELRLPVIIHCREAWADLRAMIAEHWQSSGLGGILHCFSGTRDDAFALMDCGFLVSFAGNITFKKADALRSVASQIPLDRLLTETDSPYLAPVPHRGKRNEPAFVRETARALAELRGMDEAELGRQAVENFEGFFRLPEERSLSPSR